MKFSPVKINKAIRGDTTTILEQIIYCNPFTKIFDATFLGPCYIDRETQIGPDVAVGKYCGFNNNNFFARGTMGAYCSIGARVSINPFNHPQDWLSINEFQYHPESFNWVSEYNEFVREERTPDMYERVHIGNDVWMGHNVCVMPGVTIGDGVIIGANSVVTKDIPSYCIVGGCPAMLIRNRFHWRTRERLYKVRWWEFELSELSGMPFRDVGRCLDLLEEMRERANQSAAKSAQDQEERR